MENENTQDNPKKSNTLIILMVVAVLAVGGFFLVSNFTKGNKTTTPPAAIEPTSTQTTDQGNATISGEQTFDVSGESLSYSLKEMKVKQGDKVTINFTNNEAFHDLNLDEFSVKTSVIGAGKTESITFTADKKGTFEYYCSVGNHRAQGMVGNLIVE